MTIQNHIDDFLYSKSIEGKSPNTIINYRLDLTLLQNYFSLYNKDHIIISIDELDNFKSQLIMRHTTSKGKSLSPASINRIISTVREFFKFLEYKKYRNDNPSILLKTIKNPRRLPKILELQDVRKILTSIKGEYANRDRAILFLFLMTGMRLSELSNLTLDSLHGDKLRVIGKGNKERVCQLNQQTIQVIKQYISVRGNTENNTLFLTDRNSGISNRAIQAMVERRLEQCGITHMSVHKLRHTAATLMLESGVDIRVIQEILGHENISTTLLYAKVTNSQKEKAAISVGKLINVEV